MSSQEQPVPDPSVERPAMRGRGGRPTPLRPPSQLWPPRTPIERSFREHYDHLLAIAALRTGRSDAEDVVMEVFVKVIRKESEGLLTEDLERGWWVVALKRTIIDTFRRRARREAREHRVGAATRATEPRMEEVIALRAADLEIVTRLAVEDERVRFALHHSEEEGWTQAQIAAAWGVSSSTVRGWLHRVARLRAEVYRAHGFADGLGWD